VASSPVPNLPAGPGGDALSRYAFAFAFFAAAAGVVSIAASHACLAASLALLAASRTRLRIPPLWLPLGLFLGWTLVSAAASDVPSAALPQIKKLFVFAMLVAVFSLFPRLDDARRLVQAWFVFALAAASWSIVQFFQKVHEYRQAGLPFYETYVPDRITGFYSHWMTFSEVMMIVFLVLLSYLFFPGSAREPGRRVWKACAAVLAAALLLSFTRGVWLGALAGGGYLVWHWKRRWLLAVPAAVLVVFLVAPGAARQRLASIADPEANSARLIMWRTGWNMIQHSPVTGLGLERVGARFDEFLPAGVAPEALPPAFYGHLHNVYVHYAAERGVPAALALLWLLGKILYDHVRGLRALRNAGNDRRFLLHAVTAVTLGVMVVGCFEVNLGDSEVLGTYLALIALGYRALRPAAEEAGGAAAKAA